MEEPLVDLGSLTANKIKEKLAQRAKDSVNKLDLLEEMLAIATDLAIPATQVGLPLREKVGIERMRAARRDPKNRPHKDHGRLDVIEDSFTYLRQFAPIVVKAIEFAGSTDAGPLLEAVFGVRQVLRKSGLDIDHVALARSRSSSVLAKSCSSQARSNTTGLWQTSAPGWIHHRGTRTAVGHQGRGYPVASAPEASRQARQRDGIPISTLRLARSIPLACH
jgi:hypothetical protein